MSASCVLINFVLVHRRLILFYFSLRHNKSYTTLKYSPQLLFKNTYEHKRFYLVDILIDVALEFFKSVLQTLMGKQKYAYPFRREPGIRAQ